MTTFLINLAKKILVFFKLENLKIEWKKLNPDSFCKPVSLFEKSVVKSGKYSYGDLNVISFGNSASLTIGSYCSIASEATFIINGDHNVNTISTYPYMVSLLKSQKIEAISKGNIVVDDDVWIGYRAIILSGVHIGQGAVVAAGAVVTEDVPPYAIVGGVPAKIIKYRFSQNVIQELIKVDFSKLDKESVKLHINDLYKSIDQMKLEEVKQLIAWMPKK